MVVIVVGLRCSIVAARLRGRIAADLAYVSLINEARFKAGKPQLGFANPFFYQHPEVFFDVVKGTRP